ncbi:hypothetical protein JBL43_12615 [Aureibaculum sp. A20]|uniref:DUF3108 domain-containing protein n=1 Tax=Aureibaculum flavum TaxID=2795986 RepID=A0ABS0WT07_9FLAO|nr:hypothetical protein [Aureibaculum flavum]MBJ2175087.1 hypothetical protein [Aureibaculum flavum]
MTKNILLLFFFTLAMFFSININSQELIPLQVNNSWKYIEKVKIKGKLIKTDTLISRVEKTMDFNNKKWFYMTELNSKYIVRNDEKGQYEIDTLRTQNNGDFKEVLMFRNDNKLNQNPYKVYETIKVKIDDKITLIKTEIGQFECIKYTIIPHEALENEFYEFYFKPGIGLIYHKWVENDKITTSELIQYNIE